LASFLNKNKMKVKIEKDRIRFQAENSAESHSIHSIIDAAFDSCDNEDIVNDHGFDKYNYACLPLPSQP
jgi:hypothetical protein